MERPLTLRDGILLLQEDVHRIQLAKAALRAGIDFLLERTRTEEGDIREVLLCGGFGSRINPISAARIGLIPSSFLPFTSAGGNAALNGAAWLTQPEKRQFLRELAKKTVCYPLGGDPAFNELFMRRISF